MQVWFTRAATNATTMETPSKSDSKLFTKPVTHVAQAEKKTRNSSTGANIPSPPNTPHASKQLLRERQVKKTEKDIPEMEKNNGILIRSCPPNAPSMETPCKSDSPELRQMPQPWKHHRNLTPSSSPNLSRMLRKLKKKHAIQAQGQTSQVLQIHHMPPSNCSERDRLKKQKKISQKWRKTLVFWFEAVHLMHQAWKHHASLIHQSCDKCHNHGNTIEIWLQAVHQTCYKCCTSWKHMEIWLQALHQSSASQLVNQSVSQFVC